MKDFYLNYRKNSENSIVKTITAQWNKCAQYLYMYFNKKDIQIENKPIKCLI